MSLQGSTCFRHNRSRPANRMELSGTLTENFVACGLGDPRTHEKQCVVTSDNRDADSIQDVWIESSVIYPHDRRRARLTS